MNITKVLTTTENVMFSVPLKAIRAGVVGVANTEIGPVFVAENTNGSQFFLTDCCASASEDASGETGVACGACHNEVDSLYGDALDGYSVALF